MKDYYKILEVSFNATHDEIKRSYRMLAQKYHPDIHGSNKIFEEKLKDIIEAYSILGNLNKRNTYDINYNKFFAGSNTGSTFNQQSNQHKKDENKKDEKTENGKSQERTMNNIKTNFKNTILSKPYFYTITLIFIGMVLLAFNWKSISNYFDERQKKEEHESLIQSIQKSKTYPARSIPYLKITTINFETRWKDNKMYYKFSLSGTTPNRDGEKSDNVALQKLLDDNNKNDFEQKMNGLVSFDINLIDKDGFKIYTLKIEKNQMTRIVASDGTVVGYSLNTNVDLPPETYKYFDNWEITYIEN